MQRGQRLESAGPSQGTSRWQAATGRRKRPGKGFSSPDGTNSADSLILGFWPPGLWRATPFKPQFVVLCYGSPRSSCTWVAGISPSRVGIPLASSPLALCLFSSLQPPVISPASLHPKAQTERAQGPLLISPLPPKEVKSHPEPP